MSGKVAEVQHQFCWPFWQISGSEFLPASSK